MGRCNICGLPAGLFRSQHKDCWLKALSERADREQRQREAKERLRERIQDFLTNGGEVNSIQSAAIAATEAGIENVSAPIAEELATFIASEYLRPVAAPDDAAEKRIGDLLEAFQIEPSKIDDQRTWMRFVMMCTIADTDKGKFPSRVKIDGNLPFMLEPGERVAWAFPSTEYLVDKIIRTRSTPIYGGVSMRVVSGLYVHAGAPVSHTQTTEGLVTKDVGLLVMTDRNLYFRGQHQSLKIKLSSIVTFQPFNEGFGFCKAGTSARDQAFSTGANEGWFSFTLARVLAEKGKQLN